MSSRFGTQDLLACYRRGVFPMADARDDPTLFLVDPDMRGILPLDDFHIPKRLKRTVVREPYRVTVDTAFTRVMESCAEETDGRESTWINSAILNLYMPIASSAGAAASWSVASMASHLAAPSLARACFRVRPTRQRLRWSISSPV